MNIHHCGEISPTRCNNCVFYSQWLYSSCFGWQSHPSSGIQCCIWPYTALYSLWWVRLSPETCRVKPLWIKNEIVASCWTYFASKFIIVTWNKQRILVTLRCSCEEMFAFYTCSLFLNVPCNRVHTTETTAQSSSWKKTSTTIRVSVSQLYVISLCCAAARLNTRVTLKVSRSHS